MKKILEESGVAFAKERNGVLGIQLQSSVMSANKAVIEKVFKEACDLSK